MPEVTVCGWAYKQKVQTLKPVQFVDEEYIEKHLNLAGADFVKAFGPGRKVTIGGVPKYSVVHKIVQRKTQVTRKVHGKPKNEPPFQVPEGFWEEQRITIDAAIKEQRSYGPSLTADIYGTAKCTDRGNRPSLRRLCKMMAKLTIHDDKDIIVID